jgi:hypothetical protein
MRAILEHTPLADRQGRRSSVRPRSSRQGSPGGTGGTSPNSENRLNSSCKELGRCSGAVPSNFHPMEPLRFRTRLFPDCTVCTVIATVQPCRSPPASRPGHRSQNGMCHWRRSVGADPVKSMRVHLCPYCTVCTPDRAVQSPWRAPGKSGLPGKSAWAMISLQAPGPGRRLWKTTGYECRAWPGACEGEGKAEKP